MKEADKKLEAEIRQRAILGLPLQFGIIPPDVISLCHNDRSYLLAALDREREETARLRQAINTEITLARLFWREGVFSINTINKRHRELIDNLSNAMDPK